MKIAILGAGAMGSALTTPLFDNGHQVNLWGTKYDKQFLKAMSEGEMHPRIEAKVPGGVNIFHSDELKSLGRQ